MEAWLLCTVTPGQFSSEYAISSVQSNNKEFSLFANRGDVQCESDPTLQEPVEGLLRVQVWEQRGDAVLVRLPQPSFESGQVVTVKASQLKPAKVVG
jgi:translation initiation factor IF-1